MKNFKITLLLFILLTLAGCSNINQENNADLNSGNFAKMKQCKTDEDCVFIKCCDYCEFGSVNKEYEDQLNKNCKPSECICPESESSPTCKNGKCTLKNINSLTSNSPLSDKSTCIKRGDTPFKEDKPYSEDEYEKLTKSCCPGLTLYYPKTQIFGDNSSCQPFYYPAIDKVKEMSGIFLSFYFWFYSAISLTIIYLFYWLVKKNKK